MDIEELRAFGLGLKGVEEGLPFGEDTLVFKVGGKIFLLASLDARPLQFNVKCDPDRAIDLRANYGCVLPGYHMNKRHWNTIICDGSVPRKMLIEWVAHSYDLVLNSLLAKRRSEILDL